MREPGNTWFRGMTEKFFKRKNDGEWGEVGKGILDPMPSQASENPMMVMIDESTGNKYAVDHNGLGG